MMLSKTEISNNILMCYISFYDSLQDPGASEASIRNLPPSAIGDPSNLDAMSLLAENKGRPMEGIVEQVRDGSTLRVYLLPNFHFVQVFLAGIQVCVMQCYIFWCNVYAH